MAEDSKNKNKEAQERKELQELLNQLRKDVKRLDKLMSRPEVQQAQQERLESARESMANAETLSNEDYTNMLAAEGRDFPYAQEENQLSQARYDLERAEERQAEIGKPDGFWKKMGQRFTNLFNGQGFHDNETLGEMELAKEAEAAKPAEPGAKPKLDLANMTPEERIEAFTKYGEELNAEDTARLAETSAQSVTSSESVGQDRASLQSAIAEQFAIDNPEQESPLDESDVEQLQQDAEWSRQMDKAATMASLRQEFDEANAFGQSPSSIVGAPPATTAGFATDGAGAPEQELNAGEPIHV
jgi:hypothetical protein